MGPGSKDALQFLMTPGDHHLKAFIGRLEAGASSVALWGLRQAVLRRSHEGGVWSRKRRPVSERDWNSLNSVRRSSRGGDKSGSAILSAPVALSFRPHLERGYLDQWSYLAQLDAGGRLAPVGSIPPRARSRSNASEERRPVWRRRGREQAHNVSRSRRSSSSHSRRRRKIASPTIPLSSLEARTRPDQNGSSAPILIRLATNLLDAA